MTDNVWMQGGMTKLGVVGTFLSPVRPTTVFLVVGTWVLGVLPILVLRKAYITGTYLFNFIVKLFLTTSIVC